MNMFICFFFSLYSTFYYFSGHLESHVSLTFSAYLVLFFPLQIKAWLWILRTWSSNQALLYSQKYSYILEQSAIHTVVVCN